jgi:ABC-type branched-subunit amino acid transport system permease subunit
MTATSAAAEARGGFTEIDGGKVVRLGALGGVIAIFIAAIGMFEVFDARKVIDPYLSLGYAAILWIPLYFGFKVSQRPVLEGVAPPTLGIHNVVAGAVTGAVGGAVLGGFLILADAVNLRDIFLNVSPTLRETLAFGRPATVGGVLLVAGGFGVGALGGALHLVPSRLRSMLGAAVLWVFLFAFLELVVGDILRGRGLVSVDRVIYRPSRGLTPLAALAIFLVAGTLKQVMAGRLSAATHRYRALPDARRRRVMLATGVLLIALGAFLPTLFGTFLNVLLSNVGLFILLALGLNVVVGYAGLLDLGYVAFFAVGAYTTAVVTSPRSPMITPELAFFEALPWVLLMAAIAGLIIGTPVIRMRGDYLAIVTLGFGEIARIAFLSDWLTGIFGGAQGILRIAPLGEDRLLGSGISVYMGHVLAAAGLIALVIGFLRWREATRLRRGEVDPFVGVDYSVTNGVVIMAVGSVCVALGAAFPTLVTWTVSGIDPPAMFRIILVFVAITALVSWRLQESRVGRAWMAVREDEQVAQAMGINIVTTKLLAFVIGAMLASLGGALFAVQLGTIFPHSFVIVQSIIILVIVIVGGMGSIRGVAVGAVVLIGILGGPAQTGLLREFGEFKLLLYGAILVWMMLQRPEGLLPSVRRAQELHQEEILQDAWLRAQSDAGEQGEGA